MTEPIKTTYRDIEIAYSEMDDNWQFELRGRSRTAPTLSKAKEDIDAPPPKDKKPFTRIKAYHRNYSGIKAVDITSLAEGSRYGGEVWISANGDRKKVELREIFAFTAENTALYEEAQELEKQALALREKAKQALEKMKPIDLSGCE